MQVNVDLSGECAAELASIGTAHVPEILALGISEWKSRQASEFGSLNGLLERLASLPEPAEVLSLRPSAELAARAAHLLERNRMSALSSDELAEWNRLEFAEHLVRIAKAQAASRPKADHSDDRLK